ncbi:MAG TPA: 16S rRNA (cytidine(1402)-2'-O)-methyltransferase [Streptosporangiaceae bacterium]|nr:16S rRNA (cytidine(1402)-2'-O)-methyltransferase [Streptosporangiaceae bacterium]
MLRSDREQAAYPAIAGENVSDGTPQGTLTLAAAPIGQPADASGRLAAALESAGLIAAEDTRRARRLATALGVRLTARVVSYYDDVESRRVPDLLAELVSGQDILLITDAGMPGVSDPGYRLVAAAAQAGVRVTVLPGPSAVTAALAISGLPSDRFAFEGFPPRKAGERARRFAELAAESRTLVFFESPRRIGATLAGLAAALGPDRRAVVCRELTKTHEEVLRGSLGELAERLAEGVLGEVTLVVAGASQPPEAVPESDAVAEVLARVRDGASRRDAVAAVAAELGLRKRDLYAAAVAKAAEMPDSREPS